MPVILALERVNQEYWPKFEASLEYTVSSEPMGAMRSVSKQQKTNNTSSSNTHTELILDHTQKIRIGS